MEEDTVPPGWEPSAEDYETLDRYLEAAVQQLEGIADVDQARDTLSRYLVYHHVRQLPAELAELLIQLFFQKCGRDFRAEDARAAEDAEASGE